MSRVVSDMHNLSLSGRPQIKAQPSLGTAGSRLPLLLGPPPPCRQGVRTASGTSEALVIAGHRRIRKYLKGLAVPLM